MFKKLSTMLAVIMCVPFYTPLSVAEDNKVRKTYKEAEKLLWMPSSAKFKNLYQQLHYYPLRPYLDQKLLLSDLSLEKEPEIEKFLKENKGTPLDWPLRKKWLQYTAKQKAKRTYIKYFKPTTNAELTCQFLQFKLDLAGKKNDILPAMTPLWLKGKSQPKICDPLFVEWRKGGYLKEQLVWQRIVLAGDGGDHTLLRYLGTLLPKDQQYLSGLWKKVRGNPAYIGNLNRFPNKTEKEAEIITYGLKRLVWRNQSLALTTYNRAQKEFTFTEQQKRDITYKFSLALASKKHKSADRWLKMVTESHMDNNVTQWRVSNALVNQDWQGVKRELASFPEAKKQDLQWQYWYARSLLELGAQVEGTDLMKTLAIKRHYYGFLAAAHLKQAVNHQNMPIVVSEKEKIEVLAFNSGKRALELFHLGRFNEARREWNYWLSKLNTRQRLVAAKVANEAGWYDRAIFSLADEGYMNDVDLRFPLAYQEAITRSSALEKINPAWAFAIARRESSFMSDANSPVGAKGLMQIMPRTAKQLKKKKVSTNYLFNAQNNIALGSKYLRKLSKRYDGNMVLATASYNAGPYRVSRWLKEQEKIPVEIWIETIPYKETRNYVKSVLAYKQIYHDKLGQDEQVFQELLALDIAE